MSLGVPGAVLPGVSEGLATVEGGSESPLGTNDCGDCGLGWLDTGAAVSRAGDAER